MFGWVSLAAALTSRWNRWRARSVFVRAGDSTLRATTRPMVMCSALIHPAHAAAAEFVEDSVLAEEESVGLAGEQPLGLEARQQAAVHQAPGHHPAAVGIRDRREGQFEPGLRDQAAGLDVLDERFAIEAGRILLGHGRSPVGASGRRCGRITEAPSYEVCRRVKVPNDRLPS